MRAPVAFALAYLCFTFSQSHAQWSVERTIDIAFAKVEAGNFQQAVRLLGPLVKSAGLSPELMQSAHFHLGKSYDSLGDYGASLAQFEQYLGNSAFENAVERAQIASILSYRAQSMITQNQTQQALKPLSLIIDHFAKAKGHESQFFFANALAQRSAIYKSRENIQSYQQDWTRLVQFAKTHPHQDIQTLLNN